MKKLSKWNPIEQGASEDVEDHAASQLTVLQQNRIYFGS